MGTSWSARLQPYCQGFNNSGNCYPSPNHYECATAAGVPYNDCGPFCSINRSPNGKTCGVWEDMGGFTLFQMPLEQSFYDPANFWYLVGLVVLTLVTDTVQRVCLRYAAGDRCLTSFVNRMVAELMLFGMAAVTIMTMYEATARNLSSVVVDQLHWIDVYVSVSAILLIFVGVWVWFFVVRSKEYYRALMEPTTDVTQRGLDLEVAGGYITRMLAGEFGLETTYSFGLYVREISAQGVVDLIDVNMLGWVGFASPAIIGLAFSYGLQEVQWHTSRDAVLTAILVGWFWMFLTVALHVAVMVGQNQLRHFYGTSDVNKVRALKGRMAERQGVSVRMDSSAGSDGGGGVELNPVGGGSPARSLAGSLQAPMSQRNREWIERAQELTQSLSGTSPAMYAPGSNQVQPVDGSSAPSGKTELLARQNYLQMEHGLAASLGRTPLTSIWAARNLWWMKQLLQIVMLNMCGQIACYILTIYHWIDAIGLPGSWHFLALFPPFFTLFALLPWTMHIYAQFEAYAVPRAEILDHVISDEDTLGAHLAFISKQVGGRRQAAAMEGGAGEAAWFESLYSFESTFYQTSTPTSRMLDAALDLARGEPKSYLEPHMCFFIGFCEACKVPSSKERMEHVRQWLGDELKGEKLTVAKTFAVLGLDPPPPRNGSSNA